MATQGAPEVPKWLPECQKGGTKIDRHICPTHGVGGANVVGGCSGFLGVPFAPFWGRIRCRVGSLGSKLLSLRQPFWVLHCARLYRSCPLRVAVPELESRWCIGRYVLFDLNPLNGPKEEIKYFACTWPAIPSFTTQVITVQGGIMANAATDIAPTLERLGLDPVLTMTVLAGFKKKVEKVLDKRVGQREAYRECVAKAMRDLWLNRAMPFDDAPRVERTLKSIVTTLLPTTEVPRIDYKVVHTLAMELVAKEKKRASDRVHDRRGHSMEKRRSRSHRRVQLTPRRHAGNPDARRVSDQGRRSRSRNEHDRRHDQRPCERREGARSPDPKNESDKTQQRCRGASAAALEDGRHGGVRTPDPSRLMTRELTIDMDGRHGGAGTPGPSRAATPDSANSQEARRSEQELPTRKTGGVGEKQVKEEHGENDQRRQHRGDCARDAEQRALRRSRSPARGGRSDGTGASSPTQLAGRLNQCKPDNGSDFGEEEVKRLIAHLRNNPGTIKVLTDALGLSGASASSGHAEENRERPESPKNETSAHESRESETNHTEEVQTRSHGLPLPRQDLPETDANIEDKWACFRVRTDKGKMDPDVLNRRKFEPSWRPVATPEVREFVFASAADSRDERLWEFYLKLAEAGIFVDKVYAGTKWEWKQNAFGGFGGSVPAVRTNFGVTICWYESTDGRLRLDGNDNKVDKVIPMLRDAFKKYVRGQSEHSRYTGRFDHGKVKAGRVTEQDAAKRERSSKIAGRVLVADGTYLLDKNGETGIWDRLDSFVGARSAPKPGSTPWTIYLRTGVLVSVWPDGRIKVTSTMATVEEIERTEERLISHCGAKWVNADARRQSNNQAATIKYGELSRTAAERQVFR